MFKRNLQMWRRTRGITTNQPEATNDSSFTRRHNAVQLLSSSSRNAPSSDLLKQKGFRCQCQLGKRWNRILPFTVVIVIILMSHPFLLTRSRRIEYQIIGRKQSSLDAIVTVAMCGFRATDMVRALRTMGGWKGPIYVITDTPMEDYNHHDDYHTTTTNNNNHHHHHDHHDNLILYTEINVKGNHPTFDTRQEFDQYVQGIHRFKATIYSKWHKTQIFKLIPTQDNINNVLFMDADMLAQKPLMDHWLPSIEHLLTPNEKEDECPLALYPERWYTSLPIVGQHDIALTGKYNSGMMILKRHASQNILEKWGDLLVRAPFVGRDQGKLTQVVEETGTHVCFLPNHWTHVQNEADIMDRIWFKMVGKGTYLHISSAKTRENKYQHWNHQLMQECNYTNLVFPSTVNNTTVSVKAI